MPSIASGASSRVYLSGGQYLLLTTAPGAEGSIAVVPAFGAGNVADTATGHRFGPTPMTSQQYGPYGSPVMATIACSAGSVSYARGGERNIEATVTASGQLPITALGAITPVNAAGATTQTLPDAATAFALQPFGLVVLVQRGAGVPSFAPAGSDTLRATSGIPAAVQYAMIAAQIQSPTEWAIA